MSTWTIGVGVCFSAAAWVGTAAAQVDPRLAGEWVSEASGGSQRNVFRLEANGKCSLDRETASCQTAGAILQYTSLESGPRRFTYTLQGNRLVLSGGGMFVPVAFVRRTPPAAKATKETPPPAQPAPAAATATPRQPPPAAKSPEPQAPPPDPPRPPAAPAPGPQAATVSGNTYRHAIGFTFTYPPGWRVQEQKDFVQVIPPDQKTGPHGPAEVYFIYGQSVAGEGITAPDDPRVAQHLDELTQRLSGTLRRTGPPSPTQTSSGNGAVYVWEGNSPQGNAIRAVSYTAILRGYGVALMGIAQRELMTAREPELRRMFSSFGVGAAQLDPRLVGAWLYEKNFWAGSYSSTRAVTMLFQPDGTFRRQGQFAASMDHSDSGGNVTGRTRGESGTASEQGRWAAASGKLHLFYDDGTEAELSYYIEDQSDGRVMLMQPAGGEKQLWTYKGR